MYEYKYVTVNLGYSKSGTEEIERVINERAMQGLRFIASIPANWGASGRVSQLTLVFENEK